MFKIREQLKEIYDLRISKKDYICNYGLSTRWKLYSVSFFSIFIVSAIFCFTITITFWKIILLSSGIISIGIQLWFLYIMHRAKRNGKHLNKAEIQQIIERWSEYCDVNYITEKYNLSELT